MIARVLAIAKKEVLHLTHDRFALLLTLGLPVLQLLLYGYALDTHIRHIPLALINRDSHQGGRMLAQRLSRAALFSINPSVRSEADVQAALRSGSIRVGIEIPSDFSASLVDYAGPELRVWIDGSDVVSASYVLSALEAFGFEETAQRAKTADIRFMRVQPYVLFNNSGRSAAFFIPGLVAILVQMITTLLMALSVTKEREAGTLEQMRAARVPPDAIIAGKCLVIGCVGLLESVALVCLMQWLFGIPVQGSVALLAAVLPLLTLAPLGLGLLVAAASRNHVQSLQLSYLVSLPSLMLSGFILPREFLRFPMDVVSKAFPATYTVALTRSVILRGASFGEARSTITIAVVLSALLLTAGWYSLRRTISSRV